MKRLDEILPRARTAATSTEAQPSPATADGPGAPDCPRCRGAGFLRRERPLDDPRFGRAEPCDCILHEAAEVRTSRLARLSNLGSLARFSFENLSVAGEAPGRGLSPVTRAAAQAYAAEPAGWLVITGPSGSGKTHLAAAVANRRIALGGPALFMVVPDLLDHLRASYDATGDELGFEAMFDQVRNAPFLVLDDVDAAAGTPWAREKLFQVVNHRYNAQLPTVFTCTGRPQTLDDRLATRLADEQLSTVIHLEAAPAGQGGAYAQVGGMSRERLAEMQFRDLIAQSSWSSVERESFHAALAAAREYAEEPAGWLVLLGANGCGKTHLAAAIANRALSHGRSVFFAVVPDLLDHLRRSFAPTSEATYDELFEQVRNAGLLVLDDLGAHSSTPWAEEKLYQVVNYRTVSRLPTVLTSDLKPETMGRLHPRIYARVLDPQAGKRVEILVPHYSLGRDDGAAAPGRPPRRRA